MPGSTLTTSYDPVDALEVEFIHRPKQRLGTDEANGCRDFAEVVRAPGGLDPVKETERNVGEAPDSRGNTIRSREGVACPFRPLLSPSLPHVSASPQGICEISPEN